MPTRPILHHLWLSLVLISSATSGLAQDCLPPPVVANAKSTNIFSPEQEMILGELTFQRMSGDLRFIKDPQLVAYLNKIGERLTQRSPPTGLKFQFFLIDISEANAFNVPGGYIFLSRKLVAFAKSEDEIAGVMAHELGHAVVRHGAGDLSEILKKILNVTQVGDRKDISDKYNLLIERQRTKRISRGSGHESEQQLEADRLGLYALIAAGYDPDSFASLFDRLAETKGKTGSWFGDLFGSTKPEEKRLREMIKATAQLPPQCRKKEVRPPDEFLGWQAAVVSYRDANLEEQLPGLLWKKELAPRLRSDISHFVFSPDGKYFLAQDDFAVTVVSRQPLAVVFQINAPDAKPAAFTPDSEFVVFTTENLRFEKWSVAAKKAVEMRELVVKRDCWEQEFSPDGKYLACVDFGTNLNVLDTQTGKKVWEKKEFYRLTLFESLLWIVGQRFREDADALPFFNIEFSTDSRFVVISRSNNFRFSIVIDGLRAMGSENTVVALDLPVLKTVNLGGDLKKIVSRPFLFLDEKRILGMGWRKFEEGGIFSFPEGKQIAQFGLAGQELKRTANPSLIIVKPLVNAKLGIFDLDTAAFVSGYNRTDVALWKNLMVFENRSGRVGLAETSYDKDLKAFVARDLDGIDIPVASVSNLSASQVSDNFQWLALSSKTRGAMWDLTSGERKLFVRGFRSAVIGNDGMGVGEFPRLEPVKHSLVFMNPKTTLAEPLREIPERGARQHGRFLLLQKTLKEPTKLSKKSTPDSADEADSEDDNERASLTREVRFELRDIVGDKVVWSRDFLKEAPRFFFDEFSGRLIFYWALASDEGKAKLKEDVTLATLSKQMGNKNDDYLVEIVDAFAGKSVGTLMIETGKGSFDIESGLSEGDWLVLRDSENRVLAFSISARELRHRFFGTKATVNPVTLQVAVENNRGELTLYDLSNGESQGRVIFRNGAAFMRFSVDGKRFFVLTEDQTAYAFDVTKLTARKVTTP